MSCYKIARTWEDGFVAGVRPTARRADESDHWLAGWDAGFTLRTTKNKLLNAYLTSIGERPMGTIRPAAPEGGLGP